MNKKKVLLYIDQKRRDLYPMMRLYKSLLLCSNISVRMAGKLEFLMAVRVFKPNIIIFGKSDGYHGDWLRSISNAIIFSINTEQGYDSKEDTIINFMEGHKYPRPPAHEYVDFYLLGSEITRNHLIGSLPLDKLVVVGYPRLIANTYSTTPKKVKEKFTIGFACGENIGCDIKIQNYFQAYLHKSFGYLTDVRGFLSFSMLDRCFTRYLVDLFKEKCDIIVRYRFGDHEYLINEDGIEIDKSEDPLYFFSKSDLIIMGQTTLGVEAMMCGVPVISTSRLINIKNIFDSVCNFSYIKICWQPNSLNELLELVNRRKNNNLELSPTPSAYESLVSSTYYMGGNVDHSIENIKTLIENCDIKGDAYLDVHNLKKLIKIGRAKLFLLKIVTNRLGPIIYLVLVVYYRFRMIFSKQHSEIYMPSIGAAFNQFREDSCNFERL